MNGPAASIKYACLLLLSVSIIKLSSFSAKKMGWTRVPCDYTSVGTRFCPGYSYSATREHIFPFLSGLGDSLHDVKTN